MGLNPPEPSHEYPYPKWVERDIVRELGAVYGPYTGTCFASTTETDIEHIVAASAAHELTVLRFAEMSCCCCALVH